MNVCDLNNLLSAIYGDLDRAEDNISFSDTSDCTLQSIDTPNGLNLLFSTKVSFNSGDEVALRKFFTTKINKCSLSVDLCRDVIPDYFPKIMQGTLYLKDPTYETTIDYSRLPSFLCTTYRGLINRMSDTAGLEPDNINPEINKQKFEEAFSHYSWSNYPRALPKKVYGSLIVDGKHLTDLNGVPRIIGTDDDPKCLWLKNYDSKIIDLSDFKFGSLILEECCFQKLIGLPKVLDILIIKEGRKFENGNLKYKHHFDIEFPKIVRTKFVIDSQGFMAGRKPTYNIGDMHAYGIVGLRNVYIDGNLTIEEEDDGWHFDTALELTNVNSTKGKPFCGNLTVNVNRGLDHLLIENSDIPKFNKPIPNALIAICKRLNTPNLPETKPCISARTMIFDDCDESVLRAVCNNNFTKSYVSILGIFGKLNTNKTLDLTEFTGLTALLVNGRQQDINLIDNKPLTIKLPYIKPMDEADNRFKPSCSDLYFPNLTDISLTGAHIINSWVSDYVAPFTEANIIYGEGTNKSPQDMVVFSNLLPYTLECNWDAIKDVRYDFEKVKIHNPFEFFDKIGGTVPNFEVKLLFESFSLSEKYKPSFESKLLDKNGSLSETYLDYFFGFTNYLDIMHSLGKPIADVAPLVDGIITYEVVQKGIFELSEIGSDDDFGERFVTRYSAKFNQISRKYADIDYLKQVLVPVLNEKASELLTQMTVGGF